MAHANKTNRAINTFSIVGFDPETGELGIAVASKFLSVGAVVPYAKAGVGAIATQSWANLDYGTKGLELLESGLSAEEVLTKITSGDEKKAYRQVGIVDAKGNSATFTGEETHAWAGGKTGPNFAVQGNILVDAETVEQMAEVFQATKGSPLAERLLAALAAGEKAGGDSRGKQSAALLVVKEQGSYGGYNDKYLDLRIDDHENPVQELKRIFKLHQLYFTKTKEEDILSIEGDLQDEVTKMLVGLGYLENGTENEEALYAALESYHLIENFDERVLPKGSIDKEVVRYMAAAIHEKQESV
ncbi:DUF1028 domain-containing protein [Planococcus sp. YIM B11945]|uniref:DUF1028 domain-containing protein n=1 Tax=Planococcus sp. YIM B11945 TaxID=3435410 RepID=UPI003D7C5BCD